MEIEVVFNFHELKQEPLVNFAEMKDQKLYFHKEGADKYAGLYQEARKNFGIRAGNIYFYVKDEITNWNKCSFFVQYWSWNNNIELSITDGEKRFSKLIKPNCPSNEYYLTDDIIKEIEDVFKKHQGGLMMGMTKLKADQEMKKVNEKYEDVSIIHQRLVKFYEFKRLLDKENFDEIEQLECTIITKGGKMQSIVLMPEYDNALTMEIVEDNIKRLEEMFMEQVKNFMEDDK